MSSSTAASFPRVSLRQRDAKALGWSTHLWLATHRPVALAVAIALLLLPSVVQALL